MNRNRGSLLLAVLIGATVVTACDGEHRQDVSPASAAAPPRATAAGGEQIVNVYNWPDYIAKDTLRDFEARTGIKVNYSVYSNNDVLAQQLESSPDAYDVVFPSAQPYAHELLAKNAFARLDRSKLTNWKQLDTEILGDLRGIDADNAHLVPYMWGTTGLGLNLDKVRVVLGANAALDSWGLLFDPLSAEKLSACGIGILDDELETFSAALLWMGRDPNSSDEEAATLVRSTYAGIDRYVRKYTNSSELIAGLADGSLCVALTYSGDVRQAQDRAMEIAEEKSARAPEIRYVIPREGALRWTDVIAIPRQAKHTDNAHRFIDYLMEPQVIAAISNYVAYANGNSGSTKLIDSTIAKDPGVYPPVEVRTKLRTARQTTDDFAKLRKSIWTEIVYGQL
ncbi:MAG: extracellular solute-binding protein [Lysobacteraceae bacterium]|nr:MAG: extracellular solute-binding protein [Xanthomonadaceae bacterium]